MEKLTRLENVINQDMDLVLLHEFKDFPVFMGCVEGDISQDLFVNQSWSISPNNGIIQLNNLIPLNILYQEEHGSGCVGSLWLQHHQEFAKFINKNEPKSVLEIGGAHGILSREYLKENIIEWTIIEPNPTPGDGVTAKFIKGFFDDKFDIDKEIDTIIHSHVFEHVYYPDEFIENISNFLDQGNKLIFSVPNMEEILKRCYTNCINFEHTVFITEPYIEHLLSKHGFKRISKQYFKTDHSIFYAYEKDSSVEINKLPKGLFEHNKKIFQNYIDYHYQLIKNINEKIEKNEHKSIYLFGAHIFSQYLIQFGLDTSRIICILDNDANKHQKRLYGTDLMVESPKILSGIKNPIIILKAGGYNEEIADDILNNVNPSAEFWS